MDSNEQKLLNDYAQLASHYDTDNPPVWQEVRDLLQSLKSGVSVLDIGCGTGRVRAVLPDNINYTGLDNSPELLAVARRRHPRDKFIQADARVLPFDNHIFDAVLLIAVVHHFTAKADRLKVLREAGRVLKSGGRLYLTVWNLSRPKFCKYWRGWRRVLVPNAHDPKIKRLYYAYSEKILRQELLAAGFIIEQMAGRSASGPSRNLVVRARKK